MLAAATAVAAVPAKQEEGMAPRVTLKLISTRPVARLSLEHFPSDLSSLDDEVLNGLVTDGASFQLRCEGVPLTEARLAGYRLAGQPIVVHVVARQGAGLRSPAPVPVAGGALAPTKALENKQTGGAAAVPVEAGALACRCHGLLAEVDLLREILGDIDWTLNKDGENMFVDFAKQFQVQLLGVMLLSRTPDKQVQIKDGVLDEVKNMTIKDLGLFANAMEALGQMHQVVAKLGFAFLKADRLEAASGLRQLTPLVTRVAECFEHMCGTEANGPMAPLLLARTAFLKELARYWRDVEKRVATIVANLDGLSRLSRSERSELRDAMFECSGRVMCMEATLDEFLNFVSEAALFPTSIQAQPRRAVPTLMKAARA